MTSCEDDFFLALFMGALIPEHAPIFTLVHSRSATQSLGKLMDRDGSGRASCLVVGHVAAWSSEKRSGREALTDKY